MRPACLHLTPSLLVLPLYVHHSLSLALGARLDTGHDRGYTQPHPHTVMYTLCTAIPQVHQLASNNDLIPPGERAWRSRTHAAARIALGQLLVWTRRRQNDDYWKERWPDTLIGDKSTRSGKGTNMWGNQPHKLTLQQKSCRKSSDLLSQQKQIICYYILSCYICVMQNNWTICCTLMFVCLKNIREIREIQPKILQSHSLAVWQDKIYSGNQILSTCNIVTN